MKYVMCPHCGRKLCKGEAGTNVEIECSKCGRMTLVIIFENELQIRYKPICVKAC
jgi:phage FluMu protein Com